MLRKSLIAIAALALISLFAPGKAEARYQHSYGYHHSAYQHFGRYLARRHFARQHFRYLSRRVAMHGQPAVDDRGTVVPNPSGCPRVLFCGCGASIQAFGYSVRELWLVSNWYRFPRAAPADGMIVLWGTRHVAYIRQYLGNGLALLYDANSGGGLTRVHRRNIAGLAVVNPHPHARRTGWRVSQAWPL